MTDIIVQIISQIGIAALTASGLIFLARTWMSERIKNSIKNEYDQKLETHKAELKAKSEIEIERLKSQLNITAAEHQIKFSRLHERRAEIVAETYSTLRELLFALNDYVKIFELSGGPTREERYKTLFTAHRAFYDAYSLKLIFFPKTVADKLDGINKDCLNASNEFRIFVDLGQHPEKTKKWIDIAEAVEKKILSALRDLEDEFRSLLGDTQ
ncbi:MAG: hypothetical protein ACK4GK_16180 [Ferrovibrio sp.]